MHQKFCTIYLIRHGESEGNLAGILQGHSNTPLTPTGKKQAKLRAQEFHQLHLAAAFSSDLVRAQQTAAIIASDHRLAVTAHNLLRERYMGNLEGRLWSEIKTELQAELAHRDQLPYPKRFRHRLTDAYESDEDIVVRLITILRQIALAYLNQTVLVATHGGIMRAFLVHLGFATYDQLPVNSITNTGYAILRCDGVDFFVDHTVGIIQSPNPKT